jgi:hypothetical protein
MILRSPVLLLVLQAHTQETPIPDVQSRIEGMMTHKHERRRTIVIGGGSLKPLAEKIRIGMTISGEWRL